MRDVVSNGVSHWLGANLESALYIHEVKKNMSNWHKIRKKIEKLFTEFQWMDVG